MDNTATVITAANKSILQGLPQRLVSDGLVSEDAMIDALAAARERQTNVVSYLVEHGLADAREVAIAASQEFGVPIMDLDSIQLDLDSVQLVSEKILRRHRVLPLVKRGKRLFVGIADPTNLHAIDEVKFATGYSVDAVVVEEDKLDRMLSHSLEQVDSAMEELVDNPYKVTVNIVNEYGDTDENRDPGRSARPLDYRVGIGNPVPVGDVDGLKKILEDRLNNAIEQGCKKDDFVLEIRADKDISFGGIAPVMEAGTQAGISKMNLTAYVDPNVKIKR